MKNLFCILTLAFVALSALGCGSGEPKANESATATQPAAASSSAPPTAASPDAKAAADAADATH